MAKGIGQLQGVGHALSVLEALAQQGPALGVADVSRAVGLPRSTAYRLLSTLERRGYVEQDPSTKKYGLGLRLFELAGVVSRNLGLREVALPLLERLARETQETVHLTVLDHGEALVIEKVDSPREVYLRTHVGARRPLHCTSTGKVLLAFFEPRDAEAVLAAGLRRFTEATLVDPEALRREMALVRARGYSLNWGEFREEAAGVAAPVRDGSHRVIAAIGVAAPIGRVAPQRAERLADQVVAAAEALSRRLGWASDKVGGHAEEGPADPDLDGETRVVANGA